MSDSLGHFGQQPARLVPPWSSPGKSTAVGCHVLLKEGLLVLLLSRFSRVRLCATPETAALQAPPSLGFSRQEHWSGLPCPSPMHESEKWKWSRSVVSDSLQSHGLQPTRLLHPWDFPGKDTGVGCHFLLQRIFPTQKLNWGLLHCRQMLYPLSHQASKVDNNYSLAEKFSDLMKHFFCVYIIHAVIFTYWTSVLNTRNMCTML